MSDPTTMFIGGARAAAGLSALIAPKFALEFFGVGKASAGYEVSVLGRLFGVRDFVLGASLLYFSDRPEVLKALVALGVVVDSVDVVTFCNATQNGMGPRGQVLSLGGAALFAVLGANYLRK